MLADHLLMFPDAATALAALSQRTVQGDNGLIWNPGYAMAVQVTVPDPNNAPDGRVPLPDYFVWVSRPVLDPALRDLPNNACRIIADRDTANTGQPFMLYTAPDMDPAILSAAQISPVFAGASYPFG